jgi:hypothetical protein
MSQAPGRLLRHGRARPGGSGMNGQLRDGGRCTAAASPRAECPTGHGARLAAAGHAIDDGRVLVWHGGR